MDDSVKSALVQAVRPYLPHYTSVPICQRESIQPPQLKQGHSENLTFTDVADYATRDWVSRDPHSLLERLFCLGHSVGAFVNYRHGLWQEYLQGIFRRISPEESATERLCSQALKAYHRR